MLQPAVVLPLSGQPDNVPVLVPGISVGAPLSVMPVGKVSFTTMGPVVVALVKMLTVYDWPLAPTMSGLALGVVVDDRFGGGRACCRKCS